MSFLRQDGPRFKGEKSKPRSAAKSKAEVLHMAAVAQLPCLVCGVMGVNVHHLPDPRSNMRVLPLCPRHHASEYGPGAIHYSKSDFYEAHGSPEELLARVKQQLAELEDRILGEWF